MEQLLNIGEVCKMLKTSPNRLKEWVEQGHLHPIRTPGGKIRRGKLKFKQSEIDKIFNHTVEGKERYNAIYVRESTLKLKEEIIHQKNLLENFVTAKGLKYKIYEDLGYSGLNFKRPQFLDLIRDIEDDKIDRVYITYKDRLLRFGFEMLEYIANLHSTSIEVICHNEDSNDERDMIEDVLSIVHVFSSRLYGSRSHKYKKIKEIMKDGE